jgi:DNA repair protein SbcD/Mre11
MKFAHIADCHIGSWRDPKLKDLSMQAFIKAINISIEQKVDFVLIAGDLFHTSLPGIDFLKETTKKLRELRDLKIPVYIIPGSHDFSPSGKTILDVLEEAGLMINVVKGTVENEKLKLKFTIDEKTGAKITGLLGKRGMLERTYYEKLNKNYLEAEDGFKIFMFHTSLTELKPKALELMESSPISFLPQGFDYYAGGHVHIVEHKNLEGYKNVTLPGPLFPANFYELEFLKQGSFYIYNHGKVEFVPIVIKKVFPIKINAKHKNPEEVYEELIDIIKTSDFKDQIVLLRVFGKLKTGKPSNIDFKSLFEKLYEKGAYFVMKNTSKLTSEEFEEIKIKSDSIDEVENEILKEHLGQIKTSFSKNEEKIAKELLKSFAQEKGEGEKVYEFNERMKKEIDELLEL